MPATADVQEPTHPGRAPLALAAAAFAAGIFLAHYFPRPAVRWGWAAFLLVICALVDMFSKHPRLAKWVALLALTAAGAFAATFTSLPQVVAPPPEFIGDKVEITGHVINDGALLAGGEPRVRFDLQTESMQLGELKAAKPVNLRITMYPRHAPHNPDADQSQIEIQFPELNYGDRVHFLAKLRLPRNYHNPGAFDYEGYLRGRGIAALGSTPAEELEILPGKSGSRLGFWRSRVRRSILDRITSPQTGLWNHDDAALFAAMIVGDDSLLLRHVREEFQETGVYHLLVVSGMNVGLLAFAVFWLAHRLRAPNWLASLVTIALSVFYAGIAGMGVPIQRAVLMLSLFLLARLFYRGREALNATGFAALVVLVLSPQALFEAGFQLTFLALLAIAGIGVPVLGRTSGPYRKALRHFDSTAYDLNLDPRMAQLRLDLRLITGRLEPFAGRLPARWLVLGPASAVTALYELVVVSVITQAVLVAPMRAYFHRAAIIGMPANILVLPLAGIMLNSGVLAIALSCISWPLARVAAAVAGAVLHWTLACLAWLAHFHVSQWRTPDPGLTLCLLAAAGILLALVAAGRQRTVAAAGLAVLLLSAGVAATYRPGAQLQQGKLEITAIDVGQGDSLLVVAPEGRTMLVDGGGSVGPVRSEFDFGEDVVSPYLWSRGLNRLDVVVLTHAHGDHIGGLARVIENFHPAELWLGINPETPALEHLLETAHANNVAIRKHVAGESFTWGGAGFRVLSPPGDWHPKARPSNDDSLAFLISYRQTSALLAGDLEKKMERFIAAEDPRADVLKVDHHGSATSTTPELLAAVQPRFAVITDGYRNSFGHPRQEVLGRLQSAHVRTFRTDMLGIVTFLLDGRSVAVQLDSR